MNMRLLLIQNHILYVGNDESINSTFWALKISVPKSPVNFIGFISINSIFHILTFTRFYSSHLRNFKRQLLFSLFFLTVISYGNFPYLYSQNYSSPPSIRRQREPQFHSEILIIKFLIFVFFLSAKKRR